MLFFTLLRKLHRIYSYNAVKSCVVYAISTPKTAHCQLIDWAWSELKNHDDVLQWIFGNGIILSTCVEMDTVAHLRTYCTCAMRILYWREAEDIQNDKYRLGIQDNDLQGGCSDYNHGY